MLNHYLQHSAHWHSRSGLQAGTEYRQAADGYRTEGRLLKGGLYDDAVPRRFESERQSLDIVDHPSIAKVPRCSLRARLPTADRTFPIVSFVFQTKTQCIAAFVENCP